MTKKTKQFKVYHTKDWSVNTLLHFDSEDYVANEDDYELVAVVYCLDLEQAFYFTNHVEKSWHEHMNVHATKETRSTSVGDLVENEDGELFLCAGCGWEKVEWRNDYSADSLRKSWRFWKGLYEKFNDTNAKARMDKVLEVL